MAKAKASKAVKPAKKVKNYDEEVEDDGVMPVSDPPANTEDDEDTDVTPTSNGSNDEEDEDPTAYSLGTISVADDKESEMEEERSLLEQGVQLMTSGEEEDVVDTDVFEGDDVAKWAQIGNDDDWENINPYDLDDDGEVDY